MQEMIISATTRDARGKDCLRAEGKDGGMAPRGWGEVSEALFPKPRNPGRPRKYPLREIPKWDLLCAEERMFLEDDVEGSSALEDSLPLLQGESCL